MDGNNEGFVITFQNGFKVKAKSAEYLELFHRMSCITYKEIRDHFNEEKGVIDPDYFAEIPEELVDLRKLLCFHEFILEITFQGSACEAFVIVFDVAAQEREQIALYQRLIWIDEPEPEAQEVIMDFVCRNFSGKKILLAEDNELNSEIATEILQAYGFQIDVAKNGMEAVRKMESAQPGEYDLILMDIQMPVMDGYEATRCIRLLKDPALSQIPIVAMTANAFDEDRKSAEACGMNGFLSKPIDIEEFVLTLQKVLRT